MEIKINKEIRGYTESMFFGLNARQCLSNQCEHQQPHRGL